MSVLQTSTFSQERSSECLVTPMTSSQSKWSKSTRNIKKAWTNRNFHAIFHRNKKQPELKSPIWCTIFSPHQEKNMLPNIKSSSTCSQNVQVSPQKNTRNGGLQWGIVCASFHLSTKKSSILECSSLGSQNWKNIIFLPKNHKKWWIVGWVLNFSRYTLDQKEDFRDASKFEEQFANHWFVFQFYGPSF